MLDQQLINLVQQIKDTITVKISTAESCTGGLLSAYLTSLPGSSKYFTGGIISYSNLAKMKLLKVNSETLKNYGAVSEQVAREMAQGCQAINGSQIAVSITGIAGPGGGSKNKPIGTVCFAIINDQQTRSYTYYFDGDREQIRQQSCKIALELIIDIFNHSKYSSELKECSE